MRHQVLFSQHSGHSEDAMAFPASQPNLTVVPYGTITQSHLWTIPGVRPSHHFKGYSICLVDVRQMKILLSVSQSKIICRPLKYFRYNDRNWPAPLTGLGAKGFLYMDCSELHLPYEISLAEPSCTLFVETKQDISRNAELSNSRLLSFRRREETSLQKP